MFSIRNHRLATPVGNVPFVRSPNIGGALKPAFLVIHYTASGPASDVATHFANPAVRVSAHLVIRRDGAVKQCVPFDTVGWHAGVSEVRAKNGRRYTQLNRWSIGIELENWGALKKTPGGWVSWTGAKVEDRLVVEARHKFGKPGGGWEIFTPAQINTATEAARAICTAYGIDEIVGHDDIAPGRKSDPGPAFDMPAFRAKVLED